MSVRPAPPKNGGSETGQGVAAPRVGQRGKEVQAFRSALSTKCSQTVRTKFIARDRGPCQAGDLTSAELRGPTQKPPPWSPLLPRSGPAPSSTHRSRDLLPEQLLGSEPWAHLTCQP